MYKAKIIEIDSRKKRKSERHITGEISNRLV